MKKYIVEIELDYFTVELSAKNSREAKSKALARLQKKNSASLIRKSWPDNKKRISVDEIS